MDRLWNRVEHCTTYPNSQILKNKFFLTILILYLIKKIDKKKNNNKIKNMPITNRSPSIYE